ncbi:hypothetical protein DV515_00007186 [Chloebia gouldiae]|uniref:Uncharacterized protein n=1 Tax=Chloebia gouldiae TaxID=44316 RepID=A0A3L8SJ79_CHLGU|nr:hypothetical protein DV515_00007186 [Chloebia gouldiae]
MDLDNLDEAQPKAPTPPEFLSLSSECVKSPKQVPAPRGAQKVPQSFGNSSPSTGITHLPLPLPPGSLKQLGSFQAFPKEVG